MLVTKKHIGEIEKLLKSVRSFDVDVSVDYGSLTVSYSGLRSEKKTSASFSTPEELASFLRGMEATVDILQQDANG